MSEDELEATIRAGLEHWELMRECVRAEAIANARELIERKLGALERDDFERLFEYFHTDHVDGKTTLTRFATAFTGALANKMLAELDDLNEWTAALWRADGDAAVAAMLDAFWANPVPGAGQSYPTMLLHVREPERYWITTSHGPGAGYRRLTGQTTGRSGAQYLEYVCWIRALRERFEISTHAIDLVLSAKPGREPEAREPELRTSLVADVELPGTIQAIDWAPRESVLAVGTKEGGLSFWNADTGKVSVIQASGPEIAGLVWLASGERLVATGPAAALMTWDSVSPGAARVLEGAGVAIAGSPDGTRVAVGGDGVSLFDLRHDLPRSSGRAFMDSVRTLAWSVTDELAVGDADGKVELRTFSLSALPTSLRDSIQQTDNPATTLAYSHDGSILAIARKDGATTMLVRGQKTSPLALDRKGKPATAIVWHPEDTLLATCHADGHVRVWDPTDGSLLAALPHAKARALAWSHDGRHLASGSREGNVRVWLVALAGDRPRIQPNAPSPAASTTASPEAVPPAQAAVQSPSTLTLELRLAGPRTCEVRISGETQWQESPTLLPDPGELGQVLRDPRPNEVEALGRQLFAALAFGRLAQAYGSARARSGTPLRVVLRMHEDEHTPGRCTIAEYPWETLLDPQHGLMAIDQQLRLVRSHAAHEPLAAPPLRGILRTIVGFADPIDQHRLDLYREFAGFARLQRDTAASEVLQLRYHAGISLATVRSCLHETDVFHFAGHGERGELMFEAADGSAEPFTSEALRALLVPPQVPRVVVLNACSGSLASPDSLSVAEAFLSRGVPLVIAMSGSVEDGCALTFGRELHERLAAGIDVEQAVQQARWRVYAERGPTWFMPVVWTRVEHGFALVDPNRARADPFTRSEIDRLDAEAEQLRPRVVVLQRLMARELDAGQRAELADALLEQARSEPALLERLLASEAEITRQLVRIEQRRRDPAKELHALATTLRRELVPALSSAAGSLPGLIDALRHAVTPLAAAPLQAPATASTPTDDPFALPFATSERLAADDVAALVARAKGKLQLDDGIVRRCIIHLLAGRHLVLAGPPGTGKSTLAKQLALAFGYEPKMVTANPDWTTHDTIGGLSPKSVRDEQGRSHVAYPFEPGCVLRAIEANWAPREGMWVRRGSEARRGTWLVIDEMNRAPLDQAFGDLFTALVEDVLDDPRRSHPLPIPADFRLICTANTADRRLLFEFSEALKRRFAFVEVPAFSPPDRGLGDASNLREQLLERGVSPTVLDAELEAIVSTLDAIVQRVRLVHPLGLAQVLDILTFVVVGLTHAAGRRDELLGIALIDNLVPALESLPAVSLGALAALLDGSVAAWIERVTHEERDGYRRDPTSKRIALALLDDLEPELVVNDWLAALDHHAERVVARAPALPHAATLARALRRLALERDG